MILLGFCERMKQCFGQITLCTFCLIACDIQIVIEISGYRHIDRSFIGRLVCLEIQLSLSVLHAGKILLKVLHSSLLQS